MNMNNNVVVAGGAGFVGSHICDYLLDHGHGVICIDNLITGNKDNIKHLLSREQFKYMHLDITETMIIDENIDYVLNFASPASPIDYLNYPIETMKVGSTGTHNLLELAKSKGAKFLMASTSEIYGDPLEHPQKEGYWGNVNPIGPRSVYDEAKRYSEALTMAYHRTYNLDIGIVRIFNTYGPRMRKEDGRAIPTFITQALSSEPISVFGNGSQTRSFCYVSDLVEGIYRLMISDINQPVNLGNPHEMSLIELARIINDIVGNNNEIVFKQLPENDPKMRRPDITKAKSLLEWKPVVDFNEGLKTTIEWFKTQNSHIALKVG